MATPSKASGWNFYLMGREERRLIKHEIDLAVAAAKFVAENAPLDGSWKGWLREACNQAARSVSTRSKNEWLRENAEAIAASGIVHAYDRAGSTSSTTRSRRSSSARSPTRSMTRPGSASTRCGRGRALLDPADAAIRDHPDVVLSIQPDQRRVRCH